MPQLIPFYYMNEVIFTIILLIIVIYMTSKYILPRFVKLYSTRIFISNLNNK